MDSRDRRCRLEILFSQTFGSLGLLVARRGLVLSTVVAVVLIALSFGLFTLRIESEALELTISKRGRIHREKRYYEDNFAFTSPELSSFIITPKAGKSLLSEESLEEIFDLQRWIRSFAFQTPYGFNISLEQFCFKAVDSEAQEPCYQISILNCFSEGRVFNVGGEKNGDYKDFYSTRPSFKDINLSADFNMSYIEENCKAWTGTQSSLPLILGGVVYDEDGSHIVDVGALQVAFGTKSPEALHEKGLEYVSWIQLEQEETDGRVICPDVKKCEVCADALESSRFLRAGCKIGSSDQPDSCCSELALLRESPCINVIFERQPTSAELANPLLSACGFDLVEVAPRCTNHLLMHPRTAESSKSATDLETKAASEELCLCLQTQNATECLQEMGTMVEPFPQMGALLKSDRDDLEAYLKKNLGCQDEQQVLNTEKTDTEAEVCICLTSPNTETCQVAATEFATTNPQYISTFIAASNGDAEAIQSVSEILVGQVGCSSQIPPTLTEVSISSIESENQKYQASVNVVHEHTASVKDADKLLHLWELAWQEALPAHLKTYNTIDVKWIASSSLDDAAKDAAKAQALLIAIGYILVLGYILLYFSIEYKESKIRFSRLPPGPFAAALCFFSILLGVCCTFGLISIVSLGSIKASPITMQIVPLLTVGLGVNDLFVLVSALLSVLDKKKPLSEIMFETMSIGGTSITLSSAANMTTFALGMLSPIPIVMWFSFQMVIGVFIAYIVSMTLAPTILAFSVSNWLQKEPKNDQLEGLGQIQKTEDHVEERWWFWKGLWIFFLVCFGVWLGVSIFGITRMKQGLEISEAVKADSDLYQYFKLKEKFFQSYTVNLIFPGDQDFSDPEIFGQGRKAEFKFLTDGYRTDVKAGSLSWFDFYSRYTESKVCSNQVCLNEVNWFFDDFASAQFGDSRKDVCSNIKTPEACEKACLEYCPQGLITSKHRCELSTDKRSCYCPWRPIFKPYLFYDNPPKFESSVVSYWSDFLTNTSTGLASQNLIHFEDSQKSETNTFGTPKAIRSLVYVNDMCSSYTRLKHLKQGRKILDDQSIDTFAFEYVVYAIGEQYNHLAMRTFTAVVISLALATAVMIPFITNWLAAILVTLCISIGIVLCSGTSHWLGLKLNYASFVALVVAVGLMMEFCVHIARDFMLAKGSRVARVQHSLQTMGIAVVNGGITTFLGLLPVAWTPYGYFHNYYFLQYTIVIIVGLIIGLVLLPMVLSILGPASFMSTLNSVPLGKG